MYIKTLSVSALNNYIKKVLDNDFILSNTNIKGEISNFKMHSSGHLYFSLKDEGGKINCIMFKSYASNLNFMPKDGMNVTIKGKVSVYEKDGAYQLYCNEMKMEGLGDLYLAFAELKDKLEKKGMFDLSHKKDIPEYPRKIGIVTSPTGAAIRDIINVTRRRNKNMSILIYPSLVQGINASEDIIKGIEYLNKVQDVDIIILARGGGSIEELWAFNEEKLAYAVYNSKKPIITAIGHETDFTIVDFISDRRAPTPSAGAEIAVPNLDDMKNTIKNNVYTLNSLINNIVKEKYNEVRLINKTLEVNSPINYVVNQYDKISKLQDMLFYKINSRVNIEKDRLSNMNSLISAHNPLNVLSKGYALIEDNNKNIISSIEKLKLSDEVKITLKDGTVNAKLSTKDMN